MDASHISHYSLFPKPACDKPANSVLYQSTVQCKLPARPVTAVGFVCRYLSILGQEPVPSISCLSVSVRLSVCLSPVNPQLFAKY